MSTVPAPPVLAISMKIRGVRPGSDSTSHVSPGIFCAATHAVKSVTLRKRGVSARKH